VCGPFGVCDARRASLMALTPGIASDDLAIEVTSKAEWFLVKEASKP